MLGMGQKGALQWAALPTGISMVERWMEADGVVDTQRFSSETSQSSEPWHKRGRSVPRAVIQRLPTRWGTADTPTLLPVPRKHLSPPSALGGCLEPKSQQRRAKQTA